MGNELFIQNKRVCVQPLRSRLEAIQKLQPPSMLKGYRSFVGMIIFLSMFCPELQKLLKPIYDLTGKEGHLFEEKNNRILLMTSNTDKLNPWFCTCPTKQVDFTCIPILANLQQAVHFTKYRMESLN